MSGTAPYYTQAFSPLPGRCCRLVSGCDRKAETAIEFKSPPLVYLKNETWKALAALLRTGATAK